MPNMTGSAQAVSLAGFASSTVQSMQIGTLGQTGDGRFFRFAKVGSGAALVVANALQSRVEDVDHDNITCRVTAAGSTELLITTGSGGGALDANEYAGGLAIIDTTAGLGYAYRIDRHAAIAASTNGSIFLVTSDPCQVALSTASKITLVANPYDGVIQFPATTATGPCVGGAIYPAAASEYCWIQVQGPGAALIAGTPGAGLPVTCVGAVPGGLTVHSAELPETAIMINTGRDGKVCGVIWNL